MKRESTHVATQSDRSQCICVSKTNLHVKIFLISSIHLWILERQMEKQNVLITFVIHWSRSKFIESVLSETTNVLFFGIHHLDLQTIMFLIVLMHQRCCHIQRLQIFVELWTAQSMRKIGQFDTNIDEIVWSLPRVSQNTLEFVSNPKHTTFTCDDIWRTITTLLYALLNVQTDIDVACFDIIKHIEHFVFIEHIHAACVTNFVRKTTLKRQMNEISLGFSFPFASITLMLTRDGDVFKILEEYVVHEICQPIRTTIRTSGMVHFRLLQTRTTHQIVATICVYCCRINFWTDATFSMSLNI